MTVREKPQSYIELVHKPKEDQLERHLPLPRIRVPFTRLTLFDANELRFVRPIRRAAARLENTWNSILLRQTDSIHAEISDAEKATTVIRVPVGNTQFLQRSSALNHAEKRQIAEAIAQEIDRMPEGVRFVKRNWTATRVVEGPTKARKVIISEGRFGMQGLKNYIDNQIDRTEQEIRQVAGIRKFEPLYDSIKRLVRVLPFLRNKVTLSPALSEMRLGIRNRIERFRAGEKNPFGHWVSRATFSEFTTRLLARVVQGGSLDHARRIYNPRRNLAESQLEMIGFTTRNSRAIENYHHYNANPFEDINALLSNVNSTNLRTAINNLRIIPVVGNWLAERGNNIVSRLGTTSVGVQMLSRLWERQTPRMTIGSTLLDSLAQSRLTDITDRARKSWLVRTFRTGQTPRTWLLENAGWTADRLRLATDQQIRESQRVSQAVTEALLDHYQKTTNPFTAAQIRRIANQYHLALHAESPKPENVIGALLPESWGLTEERVKELMGQSRGAFASVWSAFDPILKQIEKYVKVPRIPQANNIFRQQDRAAWDRLQKAANVSPYEFGQELLRLAEKELADGKLDSRMASMARQSHAFTTRVQKAEQLARQVVATRRSGPALKEAQAA